MKTMKFSKMAICVNQLDIKDVEALSHTCDLLRSLQDHYDKDLVLQSPNTGEVIFMDEVPRTLGILEFLLTNRVVEVNPQ